MKIFTKNYWKEVFNPELIIKTTLQTIIGTVMVGMFFMLFSDYIFKPLDLNGRWTIVISPVDAKRKENACVDIKYTVLIVQKGPEITAGGEKIQDKKSMRSECENVEIYEREIPPGSGEKIEIKGFINRKYFSDDVLTLSYAEGGKQRFTMAVLKVRNTENISGWYESNISRARGKISLEKTSDGNIQNWDQMKKSFL